MGGPSDSLLDVQVRGCNVRTVWGKEGKSSSPGQGFPLHGSREAASLGAQGHGQPAEAQNSYRESSFTIYMKKKIDEIKINLEETVKKKTEEINEKTKDIGKI